MEELLRTFLQPSSAAWSVYADELQARGDPRGELIAIELSIDRGAPEAEREQLEARAAQLRAPYVEEFDRRIAGLDVLAKWRFGYLRRVHIRRSWKLRECLTLVLDGEYSRFLAELAADFYPKHTASFVEVLSASTRPIQSLAINTVNAWGRVEPIPAAEVAALMDALPHLRALDLAGRRMLEQLEHPGLERLRISGHDVVIELADAALPSLCELDLALVCGWGDDRGARSGVDPDWLAALFNGPATSRLRSLDLSRNNPGAREYTSFLGGREPGVLFEALARTSVCGRLEQLSLPSPTDERIFAASEQLGRVATLRMPRLYSWCSVDRTRLLGRLPELEIESEYPHRPSGVIDPRERIEADSSFVAHWVSAQHFADLLEHRHEQLSPTARATLAEFWERFSRLALAEAAEQPGSARELVFDLPRFRQALDELIHGMAEDPGDFELLRGMLYEHSERGLEHVFERVIE